MPNSHGDVGLLNDKQLIIDNILISKLWNLKNKNP
jgi:hypothetical protein